MNSYIVNATITVPAWIEVTADYEAEALNRAREARPADFKVDMVAAEVEFNVDPEAAWAWRWFGWCAPEGDDVP